MAFNTKETNALLQDRHHSYKKKYFRLDICIGKIRMTSCKQIFCEEDRLCIYMKEKFKEYETRVSLAMIPFYQQRLRFIKEELNRKEYQAAKREELQFLKETKVRVD